MIVDTTRITDPYIYIWDNDVPEKTCDEIITKFEKNINQARQGMTAKGVDLQTKNSKDIALSLDLDTWKNEDELFFKVINQASNSYYQHLNQQSNYQYFTTNNQYQICYIF